MSYKDYLIKKQSVRGSSPVPDKATFAPMNLAGRWRSFWSVTRFGTEELTAYAEQLMMGETRKGVLTTSLLSLILLSASALLSIELGLESAYPYTCAILALLSLHVFFSARAAREIQALHLLGMALLVVSGSAFVLLAHQMGTFSATLLASIVLLFMLIPMVPWGMREASVAVLLIYLVFTLSTLSVMKRFNYETLLVLQFLMLGTGIINLILVARNVAVRRHDIQTRFELENAHRKTELLSYQDPLTGAWNRRYLEAQLEGLAVLVQTHQKPFYFALLDLDHFKQINDKYGHACGDLVLRSVSTALMAVLKQDEYLIRMGGDEFALILSGDAVDERVWQGITAAKMRLKQEKVITEELTLSVGLVRIPIGPLSLESLYACADQALYAAKQAGRNRMTYRDLPACGLAD